MACQFCKKRKPPFPRSYIGTLFPEWGQVLTLAEATQLL
jgi:hypothetical protein